MESLMEERRGSTAVFIISVTLFKLSVNTCINQSEMSILCQQIREEDNAVYSPVFSQHRVMIVAQSRGETTGQRSWTSG